jgi:putative flippase GtrA
MAVTTQKMSRLQQYLRDSWRVLLKEVSAFGAVGIIALGIDLGVFTWLQGDGAIKAKAISTFLSTTFAYFGNRHLSFSHRARTGLARETSFFFGINLITLGFSEAMLALFVYGFHHAHDSLTVSVVNIAAIGIGTLFRFWAYKRFVFLHPDHVHAHGRELEAELAE